MLNSIRRLSGNEFSLRNSYSYRSNEHIASVVQECIDLASAMVIQDWRAIIQVTWDNQDKRFGKEDQTTLRHERFSASYYLEAMINFSTGILEM